MSSTTVRIAYGDKLKLELFAKALGNMSLGDTLNEVLKFVENRRDEFLAGFKKIEKTDSMILLLREIRGHYGKTSAKDVDEYIYGLDHERISRHRRSRRRVQR